MDRKTWEAQGRTFKTSSIRQLSGPEDTLPSSENLPPRLLAERILGADKLNELDAAGIGVYSRAGLGAKHRMFCAAEKAMGEIAASLKKYEDTLTEPAANPQTQEDTAFASPAVSPKENIP